MITLEAVREPRQGEHCVAMSETESLLSTSLPRALTHSRVFRLSTARRLFKARHLELEQFAIDTQIVRIASEEHETPMTLYSMRMRRRCHADTRSVEAPWVLERRYSEFYAFRKRLLVLIKEWEDHASAAERETKEFIAISNTLRRPLTPDFPRRHLRVDTTKIIDDRKRRLASFTHQLITAYVDVSVYLLECSTLIGAASCVRITEFCKELELFVEVPESVKERERYWTAAIRSLTDVDEAPAQPEGSEEVQSDYECCICMTNADKIKAVVRMPGDDKLVSLPCGHHFHEDCVIDWFNTSMTCPLCRQVIVDVKRRSSSG